MAPLIVAVVFIIGLVGFGLWSYTSYLDAKEVEDAEISKAVDQANEVLRDELQTEFGEREKAPYRRYISPGETGSVSISYPKTWSAYVEEDDDSTASIEGYFHPSFVPDTSDSNENFALRVSVDNSQYDREIDKYQDEIDDGDVTARSIRVSNVLGVRLDGQLDSKTVGSMVLFPLRDKTLTIWTESTKFRGDFNDIVLKNLKFTP